MSLFQKMDKVVLRSEGQRDAFIEKLQKAHIEYRIQEVQDSVFSHKTRYIVHVSAADLMKLS